ncbi:STM2901 family protein [Serratia marcescens]|uniref:STM2901 family protein n=1 Tax=Serratia marcescens TaxID=615 RepID=UPI0037D41FB8
MDTVEELGGTYFYAGMERLTAGELFFWVMVDITVEHFTGADAAKDILAAAAIYSGQNNIAVSGKFATATPGTSRASTFARKQLRGYKLPFPMPTIIGGPSKMKVIMTRKLGTFVGRAIPVVGWAVLALDVTQIAWKATNRYNIIARGGDKIW